MIEKAPRPRRVIPPARQSSRPYVFTLERRVESGGPYHPWAVALIEPGGTSITLRLKAPDGTAHTRIDRHPLEPGGAERFFAEDLPQLGRPGTEVTRNTPSVYYVLTEIQTRFSMPGRAVFCGRPDGRLPENTSGHLVQVAADAEFAKVANVMLPTPDDALPE